MDDATSAGVAYELPGIDGGDRIGTPVLRVETGRLSGDIVRVEFREDDSLSFLRRRLRAVEPLLRGRHVVWGRVTSFACGRDQPRARDTTNDGRTSLRAVLDDGAVSLDLITHETRLTDDGAILTDHEHVTRMEQCGAERVSALRFISALTAEASRFDTTEEYGTTPRLVSDVESMLDEYRASGTLSPVPFDRSTEELLDAVRETDEFDDHTRRYLLDGDTAETLIEEISGRDDAADLYHEIGLLTDDEVLLRLLSALERDPDPDAVDGLLLLVWRTDPVVSPKAIRVLGRIGTPRVREELSRQIETEAHTDIRVAAIEVLAGWENEEYRETLRDVAECDDDPTVRKAARTVLDG